MLPPILHLYLHAPALPAQLERWQSLAEAATPLCQQQALFPTAPLLTLPEVEICFVSDEAITTVHADFLEDATPTDVITFAHGEILISLDTAAAQAKDYGHAFEREVSLYIIHGLLHLAGWEDETEEQFQAMLACQTRILDRLWPEDGSYTTVTT